MDFRVLGPLRVRIRSGRVCAFPRRKQRILLACLLLHANKPITTERLIDWLWGERPPASAAQNVHSYISGLRRGLAEDPEEDDSRIRYEQGRYILRVEPGELDAEQFEELAQAGFQATQNEQHSLGAERFARALGLWHGDAVLEGLELPGDLGTEAERLERIRLSVLEASFEARLELGLHEEVGLELESAISRHPLRERLWELRLLALYRSARRAEAIQVYHRAHNHLAAELGLEPGHDLRRVYAQILSSDPALDTPAQSRPDGPAQLPADIGTFTGRERELSQVVDLIADRGESSNTVLISAIDGMAGIGKTTLAVHAGHRLAGDYPDGQLFIDLHGFTRDVPPVDPADALERMLRSLGAAVPATLDERAAQWRSLLAGRRMLIVLDNASAEAQVRPLLPGSGTCLVLITSRRRLAGLDDIHPISLDVLPMPDAIALFARTAGADRLQGEPAGRIAEVVHLCGRLPLAIRIAAARLRDRPAWDVSRLAERLHRKQHDLAELTMGERSVAAAFGLSYEQLGEEQRRMFRLLGLHPGADFERYAAAALADTTAERSERLLEELLDAHLLQQHQAGRFRFHDLVRVLAASTCAESDSEAERTAALGRLFDHYTRTVSSAVDRMYPTEFEHRPWTVARSTPAPELNDAESAAAWLEAELGNLLAAGSHSPPAHVIQLSASLHWHLRLRGRYADSEALQQRALQAAEDLGDARGTYDALIGLAHAMTGQGRHGAAIELFERALAVSRDLGHRRGERHALNGLANMHLVQGRFDQSARCFTLTLEIAEETGDGIGQVGALLGLGNLRLTTGLADQAGRHFRQALRVAGEVGDHAGEVRAMGGLARVCGAEGDHDQAITYYERALPVAARIGDLASERGILTGLSGCHRVLGRHDRAIELCTQALDHARRARDDNAQFECFQTLGEIYSDLGRHQESVTYFQDALRKAETLQQPVDQARAHDGLATAACAQDQPARARQHWTQALAILREVGLHGTGTLTVERIQDRLQYLDQPCGGPASSPGPGS